MRKILKCNFLLLLIITNLSSVVPSYAAAPIISNLSGDNATIMVASTGFVDVNRDSIVTDSDSANFNGGSFSVQRTSGNADGSFSVTGTGTLGVASGTSTVDANSEIDGAEIIFVDGVAIASVSAVNDGQKGNNLIFNFGSNATPARVQKLIRNLQYTAPSVGERVFDFTLEDKSLDPEIATATVMISVVTPEIEIKQGITAISSSSSYDFGSQSLNSNTDVIFTIENTGTGDLTLASNIAISGESGDQYSVQSQPDLTIAPGGDTTFTIRFSPTTVGTKNATIEILSDDLDESSYTINLSGIAEALPEIEIKQGVTYISSNDSFDFGSQSLYSNTDVIFTIENTGTGDLILVSDIGISGDHANQFSIQLQPDLTIAANASTTFTIRYSPTMVGTTTAAIEILSNDADESAYTINLSGTAVAVNNSTRNSRHSNKEAYEADIFEDGEKTSSLTVNTNSSTKNVIVNISNQMGRDLMEGDVLTINMPSIQNMNCFSMEINSDYIASESDKGTLNFHTDIGSLTIPSNMLTEGLTLSSTNVNISLTEGAVTSLSDEINRLIGDRPIIQLMLTIEDEEISWSNPDAPVTVSIPYTPTAEELTHPESIIIWYIDGSGNAFCVPNGFYDADTGTVTFKTTHFSFFAVGYNPVKFKDVIETAWYSQAIGFVSAREMAAGTGNSNFGPMDSLTRGQFLVMLLNAYGIEPDINGTDNFVDAGKTYYTGYLATAKRLGIAAGTGDNMFEPDKEITRQELFTMLSNMLNERGMLLADTDDALTSIGDADDIADWAKDSVRLLVNAGIIEGRNGNLNPKDIATRAEMAQILYNLLAK